MINFLRYFRFLALTANITKLRVFRYLVIAIFVLYTLMFFYPNFIHDITIIQIVQFCIVVVVIESLLIWGKNPIKFD